jgi:hypothetical protein
MKVSEVHKKLRVLISYEKENKNKNERSGQTLLTRE